MGSLSLPHLLLLIVILLIIFPNRLPQMGQSLGKAIKGFKEGINEVDAEAKNVGPQQQIKQPEQGMQQAQSTEVKKENS